MSTTDRGWAPVPAWRTYTSWLAFAVCTVLAVFALEKLARIQLIGHLDHAAGDVLGALVHSETPHKWSARIETDIVARRAFGTSDYSFDASGFRVRSQGEDIEIGLVVPGAIDLRRYANLKLELRSDDAGSLAVVVRSSLDSEACSTGPIDLLAGTSTVSVNLRRLEWTCAGTPSSPPDRAEMLRLRLHLEPASTLALISAEARTNLSLSAEALDQLQLPLLPTLQDRPAFERALDRASSDTTSRALPIMQLSTSARVEQTLVARDLIEQRIADAIIVANGHFPAVADLARQWKPRTADAEAKRWPFWLLGLYAMVLVWIRLRPPTGPRMRAIVELLGVSAVPVALITGGAIGNDISQPVLGAGIATLAFALSLLIGSAPARPGARTLKRGWWVALFSIGLACAVVLGTNGGHLPDTAPHVSQVLHYLVWAAVLQFIICVIVAERIERIFGSALWAALGAALIFALLTTPNAMLMQLSLVGGLIWVWNWQRHRALLANILAHAICALLLVTSMPADWLHSGEVSARFFMN
ncbi:hypothetical protein [Dokdonella sp.]|uniref:hypothetical protein n=1 Tax=Dokdonella sp. TaxID=2291710 RepID=UPI00352793F7